MKVTVDLSFDEILRIVKNLPAEQLSIIKKELEAKPKKRSKDDMRELLLNGPTFSEEQIKEMENAREDINRWRSKPL